MAIARYFNPKRHEGNGTISGVPLRDITEEEWKELAEWQQRSVDACPFYRKTKPPADGEPDEEDGEQTDGGEGQNSGDGSSTSSNGANDASSPTGEQGAPSGEDAPEIAPTQQPQQPPRRQAGSSKKAATGEK